MKLKLLIVIALAVPLAACTKDDQSSTLTMLVYDSFPLEDTPLNEALAVFTDETGIKVRLLKAGDAGTMVTKATLTAGNPEGDVMWGVDNTLLSAATDADIFESPPVQVDFGDVCVNFDIAWFAAHNIAPPSTLDDLLDPQYANLLVVEDPSSSSTGLAFLLATIARYGETAWETYWTDLRANGVDVAPSWDVAYYERFSGAAGSAGERPLVVSYGTSPPAEVVFADPPRSDAPTGVSDGTCFRQQEYAGVLRGSDHSSEATQLVHFMLTERFQRELPLTLFVFPVDETVALPVVFTQFAVVPTDPFTVDPDAIAAHREEWQDRWNEIVLR
ncbi:thiamine ABC transporter substrate-binding protein [soil metagenome]